MLVSIGYITLEIRALENIRDNIFQRPIHINMTVEETTPEKTSCPQVGARKAIESKDGKTRAAEFQDAINVNIRKECRDMLAPIVSAIRYAENGASSPTHLEYGIIHPRVKNTYRSQAGWCAATVQKNYDRWVKGGSKGDFITYLGHVYAPIGVDNDPDDLNQHWITNVTYFTKQHSTNC